MKNPKITLAVIMAVLLAAAAFILVLAELRRPVPADGTPSVWPESYDGGLYALFQSAEERGDLISMNKLYERNLSLTGIPFPGGEYDPTHGGVIYTYPFRVSASIYDEFAGNMYIVQKSLNREPLSITDNDYVVLDGRANGDPEFEVIDSYRADNSVLIRRLCSILLEHEELYPTDWERTLDSMVGEWQIHNAAYAMNYRVDKSKNVNLNNGDEDTDWLSRAFKEVSGL